MEKADIKIEDVATPNDVDIERTLQELEKDSLLKDGKKKEDPLQDLRRQYVDPLVALIRVHIEMYPKIFASVLLVIIIFVVVSFIRKGEYQEHTVRHSIREEVEIKSYYDEELSKMHTNLQNMKNRIRNWCLFGKETDCTCTDPLQPSPRVEVKSWALAHRMNLKEIGNWLGHKEPSAQPDVVIVGDDFVEGWRGRWMGMNWCNSTTFYDEWCSEERRINGLWRKTFGSPNSKRTGIALGIAGDRSNNLLWRLEHGEMHETLKPKVWWLSIGANDLALTGCSEEAVVLGIIGAAEHLAHSNPDAKVVVQAILPRSNQPDGSLIPSKKPKMRENMIPRIKHGKDVHDHGMSPFGKNANLTVAKPAEKVGFVQRDHHSHGISHHHHDHAPVSENALAKAEVQKHSIEDQWLWPSIQSINTELARYCLGHDQMIYFDAGEMMLAQLQNQFYTQKSPRIISDLMPDYKNLNARGYALMQMRMEKELDRIIDGGNYANDIEEQPTEGEVEELKAASVP